MKKTKSIVVAVMALALGLGACSTKNERLHRNPGKIYAPDMTYSQAYDAYTENPNFENGETSRLPVEGTIARGHELPDHLEEGNEAAYAAFTTDMRFADAEVAEGGRLYKIYCGVCHGNKLDGQGPLYTSGKFLAAPANLKDAKYLAMTQGTMYAAVKYGKNMMGSYASQLSVRQRWMVIAYIKKIQSENGGEPFTLGAKEEATAMVTEENNTLKELINVLLIADTMNERFEIPGKLKKTSMALMLVGILVLIIGGATMLTGDHHEQTRFWVVLLQNSVFFLMLTVASVFIQAAASLAQGGWIVAYKRIPEAIGHNVLVFGVIAAIVLLYIVFGFGHGGHNAIYHWVHPEGDAILEGKKGFLNPTMFTIFTVVTIGLWAFFGRKFRSLSLKQESAPKNSTKIYWTTVKWAAGFLLVYALTQMSTTPWLWIMSIDAHWFSTMFSWYTFASAFVSGMAVILLFVGALKNNGYLQLVTKEHMHDLGKFLFAFSIFWTYVWFAQYMLIWYGNIPEETTYFKIRQQGPYAMIWYSVFIINFIMPILILMSRPSKRNYFTITFMAVAIIFGHWLDFFIMTMPGPLGEHWSLGWFEIGVFAGFAGLLMFVVYNTLAKASLVPINNPLLKEAIIHES